MPVVPLRAAGRGRKPNLFVRSLLVDDVRAVRPAFHRQHSLGQNYVEVIGRSRVSIDALIHIVAYIFERRLRNAFKRRVVKLGRFKTVIQVWQVKGIQRFAMASREHLETFRIPPLEVDCVSSRSASRVES